MTVKSSRHSESAEKTTSKQRGKPFKKGQSGNPTGRPKGARNQTTMAAEALMVKDAENVVRAVIEKATSGDMTAAKIILDRVAPVRKGSPVALDLPKVRTASDVAEAIANVIHEMASGTITPDEAASIAGVIELRRRAIETVELEERLTRLEVNATVEK